VKYIIFSEVCQEGISGQPVACYNANMLRKEDLLAYRERWAEVEAVQREELRSASVDLRWQQLNAIIDLAIGLGIFKPAEDESEVYQQWAKLKEKAASQKPRVSVE